MSDQSEKTPAIIYSPDDRVKSGFIRSLHQLILQIIKWRWHIWIRFKREFRKLSIGSSLGAVWNIIMPIVPLGAYTLMAYARVFPERESYPAVVYLAVGVTVWFLFVDTSIGIMNAVKNRLSVIGQTSYPLIGIVSGEFAKVLFSLLVRVIAASILIGIAWGPPSWGVLILPIFLLPSIAFSIGLGLILSVLAQASDDVSNIATITSRYAIFLSNAIFPVGGSALLAPLGNYNPAAIFIDNARSLIFYGNLENPTGYIVASIAGIVIFLVGARLFYVMEFRIRSFLS